MVTIAIKIYVIEPRKQKHIYIYILVQSGQMAKRSGQKSFAQLLSIFAHLVFAHFSRGVVRYVSYRKN